jgi:hypothetical protein
MLFGVGTLQSKHYALPWGKVYALPVTPLGGYSMKVEMFTAMLTTVVQRIYMNFCSMGNLILSLSISVHQLVKKTISHYLHNCICHSRTT